MASARIATILAGADIEDADDGLLFNFLCDSMKERIFSNIKEA